MLITVLTFAVALAISFLSETVVRNLNIVSAFVILIIIILIGIVFDIIGIAVAASSNKPLNAMAAQKIPGAREAVFLHKNAGIVSNICNDVIGDICGIVSGAAGAVIVSRFILICPLLKAVTLGIFVSSAIAAMTVGGKALGKNFAIKNASDIAFKVGRLLSLFHAKTGLKLMDVHKKNGRKR